MKMLVYNIKQSEKEDGAVLSQVLLQWSEANEAIAKQEAYNGEYTVEEMQMPEELPTQLDRVEAQATYTAMMTDTLLEGISDA